MKTYYKTLTIAGSDSGGGAGIQADLKTFSALNCYGMSVITALTAQNTLGVQGILPIPPQFVALQLRSILDDMSADAIKTGMLHSEEVIASVVAELLIQPEIPLLVDPVMVAKDGSLLLENSALDALKNRLFPRATLITPNLPEAEILLQTSIKDAAAMEKAASALATFGSQAVLLKGGHLPGNDSNDCLYLRADKSFHWFKAPHLNTNNTHGTGCTLSAAITAFIARGATIVEAVAQAKDYVHHAIQAGSSYKLGKGYGPVKHS